MGTETRLRRAGQTRLRRAGQTGLDEDCKLPRRQILPGITVGGGVRKFTEPRGGATVQPAWEEGRPSPRPRSPGLAPLLQALSPAPLSCLLSIVFVLTEMELAGNVMLLPGVQCKDSIFTRIAKERGVCLHDQRENKPKNPHHDGKKMRQQREAVGLLDL